MVYSFGGSAESPDPSTFPKWLGRGLFQVLFHPMTQSTQNLWLVLNLGNSSLVTGYEADELTHIWLVEHFAAQSHMNPQFPYPLPT